MMNKKLLLISALLFSFNGWAYNETDLAKFKALNACIGCDLSDADLSDANLGGANLYRAKLDEAIFCRTQMPWGEVNDDCEE